MRTAWRLFQVLLLLLAIGAAASLRILEERYTAFRTLLGDPEPRWFPWMDSELVGPRLYIAIPLLHQVEVYDQRIKHFESEPREVYLDQDNVEIGYFVVWRIENVRRLRENLQPTQLLPLIDDKTYNAVRNELATRSLRDLLSETRGELADRIREQSDRELDNVGIDVLGVGIRQVAFLDTTLPRVFDRMKQDRERLAKRLRAEGEEQAKEIRAQADRDAEIERAKARSEGESLRGEGDALAAEIYARAYDQDREFYRFTRSLEAYRKGLDEQTTLFLSPSDPFLRYFFDDSGGASPPAPAEPVTRSPPGTARVPAEEPRP